MNGLIKLNYHCITKINHVWWLPCGVTKRRCYLDNPQQTKLPMGKSTITGGFLIAMFDYQGLLLSPVLLSEISQNGELHPWYAVRMFLHPNDWHQIASTCFFGCSRYPPIEAAPKTSPVTHHLVVNVQYFWWESPPFVGEICRKPPEVIHLGGNHQHPAQKGPLQPGAVRWASWNSPP